MTVPQSPLTNLRAADKTGLVIPLALGAVGVYVFSGVLLTIFGTLVELAKDTTYLIIMGAAVALLIANWRNILYGYAKVALSITRALIKANPADILDISIARLERKQDQIVHGVTESAASVKRMKARIHNTTYRSGMTDTTDPLHQAGALDRAEEEESLAQAAKEKGRPATEVQQHAVAADRFRALASGLQPRLEQLQKMQELFGKAKELADAKIADMKSQREILVATLEADQEGAKTVGLFKRILGRSPELTMAQLSVNEIIKQSSEAEAEIDEFMEAITPQLQEQDLKKSAAADTAMRRFETATQKLLPTGVTPPAAAALGVKEGEVVGEKRVH